MTFVQRLKRVCLPTIAFAVCATPLPVSGRQTAASPPASPLARKVHLSPETVTVAAIMQVVSEQTGLTVRVASYLRDRKIILQVRDMPASDLLNTLVELNDWTWRGGPSGVIFIDRRKKDTPKQMADVPVALQLLMPADFRTFFGSTGRLNDPMYHEEPDARGHTTGGAFRNANPQGMRRAAQSWKDALYPLLAPGLQPGFAVTYPRLSDEQRRILVISTVLSSLAGINSANSHDILQGTLRPYELNLADAEITLEDKTGLMIGTARHPAPRVTEWAGFGMDVKDALGPPSILTPPQ